MDESKRAKEDDEVPNALPKRQRHNEPDVQAKAEEQIVTDVLCKHSDLLLPYLDRVSWNRLCMMNSQIYKCSRSMSPPWPQKLIRVGSTINSVAFSADSEWLACGSDDGIVRLWNKRNGNCSLLEGHEESISCVSFSPNGKMLASGSHDQSIRLWKLDAKSSKMLLGQEQAIRSIAFSPSGLTLASGPFDGGEARLWDVNERCCIKTFSTPLLWSVAFSPDGASLATGGSSISLWDLENDDDSFSPSSIIDKKKEPVRSLEYSRNGLFLLSIVGFTVNIWRLSNGSLEKALRGHKIYCACFSPNGELVAAGHDDGSGAVRIWTMKDRDDKCCLAVSPHVHRYEEEEEEDNDADVTACVNSVAFTLDGQNLACGGDEGSIFLWDTRRFL